MFRKRARAKAAAAATHDPIWQLHEIRWDRPFRELRPRGGEVEIDSINSVEDTKGNNGEKGGMSVTNLRIIWFCHRDPRVNLSIGLARVLSTYVKTAKSRLKGTTQSLYIRCKQEVPGSGKPATNAAPGSTAVAVAQKKFKMYEFVFTSLVRNSPRLFTTINSVLRSFETSTLFRELKLRGAIIKQKQLLMLPGEEVYNKVNGVWNVSGEQGNVGTLFVTNVRVVWYAQLADNFNVSLPYMQIRSIRLRDSDTFGKALVLYTTTRSGGYTLGFRVDPPDRLHDVYKEVTTVHGVYAKSPVFGVDYRLEARPHESALASVPVARVEDDVSIVEHQHARVDALGAYLAETADGRRRRDGAENGNDDFRPVYDADLGLAIERLPPGVTASALWGIDVRPGGDGGGGDGGGKGGDGGDDGDEDEEFDRGTAQLSSRSHASRSQATASAAK